MAGRYCEVQSWQFRTGPGGWPELGSAAPSWLVATVRPAVSGVLEAGKGLAQRVQAHAAQAERLGVEVLEAEGGSGPRLGIFPGLEPDPLAELVGRGLPGPAEEAVQLKAQPLLFPAG